MTILSYQQTLIRFISLMALSLLSYSGLAFAQAEYGEAPQLTQRVEAGQLPPVHERLPVNPMVVPVVERIGDYGGTWRTALTGPGDTAWLSRTIGYENLVRVNRDWTEIIPNIAESFEVSEDATEYTFRLREGMKWSDGHPLTADDLVFWYEDVFMNEELTPVPTSWLVTGGEPVVVEKLDDYTVVFRFAEPNGLFLTRLAAGGSPVNPLPRHYLEQFHISYNSDGIDALVRESGLADWAALFANRNSQWDNAERPSLLAWVVTSELGEGTRFVVERNPYYWKIDEEGNQLPYLDSVIFEIIADTEVMLLRALSGELDMHERHFNTATNKAILFDNMERGDYRFFDTVWSSDNRMVILLNLTHQDPVKREIFQNKDFRAGLSHAINRQEIIDLVFVGEGEPMQAAPRPEAPFYNEELALQFTEYDPDLANEYLDNAGYSQRDAQGFRLGPDGNRISFTVELFPNQVWVDSMELIQGYWREVGIDAQVRVIDRSLYQTRFEANEHDAGVWFGGPGLMDAMLDMRWYMPGPVGAQAMYAVRWVEWFQGAQGAEEPPEEVQRQMDLYRTLLATADEAGQIELMQQILEITQEQFYAIGITSRPDEYGIVRNNFRNVPEWMFASPGAYNHPAPTNPEQYFIEQRQ